MLRTLNALPQGFLDADARGLQRLLQGPTLVHLAGRRTPPLFVSVLLHGNEVTGLGAIQQVLRELGGRELPRALSLFVGNVDAAARGERMLPGQPDYNRIWPGSASADTPEHAMARAVLAQMVERGLFASLDVHNNTGINPHYGCVGQLDRRHLQLAALFSRLIVYTRRPLGTQCNAFTGLCPAVTIECGKSGDPANATEAARFIAAALHLEHVPDRPVDRQVALYHTVATVKVAPGVEFGFGDPETFPLAFEADLDHCNFQELPTGTRLARCGALRSLPLVALDEGGNDVSARYFELRAGELRTRIALTPAMLTVSATAVRQDCLCYLMEDILPTMPG